MSILKHNENIMNRLDSEETVNKGNDYKGIFYNDNSEKKQYEGGAHFSYKDLYKRLSEISKCRNNYDNDKPRTNFKYNELYRTTFLILDTKLKEKSDQIKQKLKFNQSSLSINKNFSTLKNRSSLNADKLRKKIIPETNENKNIPIDFLPAKNINLTHLNVNFNLNFNNYNETTGKIKDRNSSSRNTMGKENYDIEDKLSQRDNINRGNSSKNKERVVFKKVNPELISNKSQRK
jgi:hypothetical protein